MLKGKVFVIVPITVLLMAGGVSFLALESCHIWHVLSLNRPEWTVGCPTWDRAICPSAFDAELLGGKRQPAMLLRPVQDGPYRIEIDVRYGSAALLNQTYSRASDGAYGFRVLFLLERASSYIIKIRASAPGSTIQPAEISFRVIPS